MNTFTVIDNNKPRQVFTDCTGCVLEPRKYDQIVVYTASGHRFNVGPQMLHDLCNRLYEKILEAAQAGKTVTVPNMEGMNEDQIRVAIAEIKVL